MRNIMNHNQKLQNTSVTFRLWENNKKRCPRNQEVEDWVLEKMLDNNKIDKRELEEIRIQEEGIYKRSIHAIAFLGYLPNKEDDRGCCIIRLQTERNRDTAITLLHTDIVKFLMPERNISLKEGKRHFVVGESGNSYEIQIKNIRFLLTRKEMEEFLILTDDFTEVYLEALRRYRKNTGLGNFCRNEKGEIVLIRLPRQLCEKIHDFANTEDKPTEWDIFEANKLYLKIFTQGHPQYRDGYHAIISFRPLQNGISWRNESEFLWLWLKKGIGEEYNKSTDWWSPEQVDEFLRQKLIPYILYQEYVQQKFLKPFRMSLSEFCNSNLCEYDYEMGTVNEIDFYEIRTSDALVKTIEELSIFFAGNQNYYYLQNGKNHLFLVLKELLRESVSVDTEYLTLKLNLDRNMTSQEICEEIKRIFQNGNQTIVFSWEIDNILQCIQETLQNGAYIITLSSDNINRMAGYLKDIIQIYNDQVLLSQYSWKER